MEFCRTCKHWDPQDGLGANEGYCQAVPDLSYGSERRIDGDPKAELGTALAYTEGGAQDNWGAASWLITLENFGCVMHEERESSEVT